METANIMKTQLASRLDISLKVETSPPLEFSSNIFSISCHRNLLKTQLMSRIILTLVSIFGKGLKKRPKKQLTKQILPRMMRAVRQSVFCRRLQADIRLEANRDRAYKSVKGAKRAVPMPDAQIAIPVTRGLFFEKY